MRIKVKNNSLFKILKIKNGLTISEITQDKIHRATYNYIETGHTKYVHPKTAKILCESFQKTFDELFEIEGGGENEVVAETFAEKESS